MLGRARLVTDVAQVTRNDAEPLLQLELRALVQRRPERSRQHRVTFLASDLDPKGHSRLGPG